MKKLTLIFAMLAFFVIHANAQFDKDGRGGLGIRGGGNFYTFGGGDISEDNYTNVTGFHLGIYSTFYVGQSFAVEPGVYYSKKGARNDDIFNSRALLNYIDLPILARLYLTEGLNIFAGPQISFLTSSSFEGDLFGSTISIDTDSVNKTDYGIVLGLGYNLPKGLNLQGSYNYGLAPSFKNSETNVYNRGFNISLGLTF
jgi:hypothetical protein